MCRIDLGSGRSGVKKPGVQAIILLQLFLILLGCRTLFLLVSEQHADNGTEVPSGLLAGTAALLRTTGYSQSVDADGLVHQHRYGGDHHSPVKSVLWRNSGIAPASQLPTDITVSMESELVTQPP